MSSIIGLPKVKINIDDFEKNNDLTQDNLFMHDVKSGTFNTSDGVEHGYHFYVSLSVFKTNGEPVIKPEIFHPSDPEIFSQYACQ